MKEVELEGQEVGKRQVEAEAVQVEKQVEGCLPPPCSSFSSGS